MSRLTIPITKVDDDDRGEDIATSPVEATLTLVTGAYKIAAQGTSIKWKLGAVAVTASTGSYLADGDQEIIRIPVGDANARTLRVIRSPNSVVDGEVNVTVANLYLIPTQDPRFSS